MKSSIKFWSTTLALTLFINNLFAGDLFSTWCTTRGGGTSVDSNTTITEFQGVAPRAVDKTGLYYVATANVELSDGYHYYIAADDKTVYDSAKIAFLTGARVDVCILNGGNQNTFLTGVRMY